jgi:hypothetical protein
LGGGIIRVAMGRRGVREGWHNQVTSIQIEKGYSHETFKTGVLFLYQ